MSATTGVHLTRTDENVAEIDALASSLSGRVGLAGVLADLDRRARRTWAPGRAVRRALTWEDRDRRDHEWWPQGITSSAEAGEPDASGRLLVVSWYAKHAGGSRITVLDLDRRRYQHVLLVEPTLDADGTPGVRPLKVHAGGLVWHGPYLHVAATGRGLVTCRLDDIMRVPDGAPYETFGHRYVLPVRFAYRAGTAEGHEKLRYSFVSLERSEPALVVGEYGGGSQTRRLARYPVDPDSLLLAADEDRASYPPHLDEGGVARTQGAVVVDGRYYLTRSHGPWTPGSVYVGRPGAFRRHRWAAPMGPEDLTWWPSDDLLWSVSEHPGRRWVYAMPRRLFD
ncbi:hypothetical protein [Nocardioides dongkuii]|uniref:hypothetical protein n=1 Tax=Nocardioides dongkuii TaxID=2760089 RepID=UPI0015FD7021|nr:hypothetical protein [Nocardioides dongkuii]